MRKCIIFFTVLIMSGASLFANQDKKAKEALLIGRVLRMCWDFSNEINLQPAEYLKDTNGRIIGQNFLYPFEFKYYEIDLIWDGEKPDSIIYYSQRTSDGYVGKDKVQICWNGGEIERIKADHMYKFDYMIKRSENSIVITQKELAGKGFQVVYEAFFEGEELKRIEKQLYKGSKKITNGIKHYESKGTTHSLHVIVSNYGKPLKPKFEYRNNTFYYKEIATNEYELMGYQNGRVKKMHHNYNNLGQLDSKRYLSHDNDEIEEKYKYIDNRLFQEIVITKKNEKQIKKEMRVYFDAPNQDASLPVYDNKKGSYDFDSNDELVYERIGTKYRKKTNGVWSGWQSMIY